MKSIELFAGAGGSLLGLESAGFENEFICENDKNCCETLSLNLNKRIEQIDVKELVDKLKSGTLKFKNIDLISMGMPCQPYSFAGKCLGLEDLRGSIFYNALEVVSLIRPRCIMIENVKGLLYHNQSETLQIILNAITSIGYKLEYFSVLNASNYGVAQTRERLFILAVDSELKLKKKFEVPECTPQLISVREALYNVPLSDGFTYGSDKKYKILDKIPEGGNWKNLSIADQKEYLGNSFYSGGGKTGIARRLSWDSQCPTLTCSPYQKQTERCHPSETRPLTVREYARIQSFPDHWRFCGSLSSQYKQIGNALPVKLAQAVGNSIYDMLY